MSTLTIRVKAKQLTAPLVDAGVDRDIQLPLNTITINGAASDPDGTIASTLWTQNSGPAVVLNNPNALNLQIDNLVAGDYEFQLTATDNDGLISSDVMSLSVAVENILPVANAGPDVNQNLPTNTHQLAGSGTDTDGVIVEYAWAVLSSPVGSTPIFNPSSNVQNPIIEDMNVAGTYTLQLTVVDNNGGSHSDTMIITIGAVVQTAPTMTIVGGIVDANGVSMGSFESDIDTDGHDSPFRFDVQVDDPDDHAVTVVMEAKLLGEVQATDTKIAANDGDVVTLDLTDLLIGTPITVADYTIEITATDIDGLTDFISRSVGFFDSTASSIVNGGLPINVYPPTVINDCVTQYQFNFVVPSGETGTIGTNLVQGQGSSIGTNLTNVGAGTYIITVTLENSNSLEVDSIMEVTSTLSGGDTGFVSMNRPEAHSSQYDQTPC